LGDYEEFEDAKEKRKSRNELQAYLRDMKNYRET
jgi:hypothetical protein